MLHSKLHSRQSKDQRNNLYIGTVDFSGAFDHISWPRLFTLLKGLQRSANIYNLLLSYVKILNVNIKNFVRILAAFSVAPPLFNFME